ncbi:MAG TPA: DUF1924 domain-containing protein [Methylobacter sp.]|jgi:hypothetical protein
MKLLYTAVMLTGSLLALPSYAEQPQDFLGHFAAQAKIDNPGFTGFDAGRGEQFFKQHHKESDEDWSCSSCHTDSPTAEGKHAVTNKVLQPLAPSANPERFTKEAKVEKWFKRNCKDVLKRECTAQEKGDLLTYLMSLGK